MKANALSLSFSTITLERFLGFAVVFLTLTVQVRSEAQFERWVVSSGNIEGTVGGAEVLGTVGEPISGSGSVGGYSIFFGFDAVIGEEGCCLGDRGNILLEPNCDATDQVVDISDLTLLISHLFISFRPICCIEEADISPDIPDGVADIGDLTGMIDYLFISHPTLPSCP